MPMNMMKSIENYIYKGSTSQLSMTQRFKIICSCIFKLSKFPFDEHECNFIMKLKVGNNNSIIFAKDEPAVLYQGPDTVDQFKIFNVTSKIINDVKSTNFIFSVRIYRIYMNQMLSTFLPTSLLWSLAYFTLFIDIDNFSDRFIGTVTALLVLVALLSSVNGDLPKTSYFKFIDFWFLWYISSILFIILFHIFLNHIPNNQIGGDNNVMIRNDKQAEKLTLRAKVNKLAIILFAVTTVIFVIIYFNLTA